MYTINFKVTESLAKITSETVDEKDPRIEGPDSIKNLLLQSWESAINSGSKPEKLKIGALLCNNLMKELGVNWTLEQSMIVCILKNSTINIYYESTLKDNEILVE